MGDAFVGLQARLMSQALRKLTAAIARSKTMVIFINQLREKIGVMYGSPETTPGGRALKFYASLRIDMRRIESIKDGQTHLGNRVRVKMVKKSYLRSTVVLWQRMSGRQLQIRTSARSPISGFILGHSPLIRGSGTRPRT
jgi:RecA/RadA recombinase